MKQSVLANHEADLNRPPAENNRASRDVLVGRRLAPARRHRGLAKISTVLVPSDFSTQSIEAAHYATGFAKFGAKLHFIHVSEVDFAAPDVALIPSDPVVWEKEGARALKERFERATRGAVSATFHERTGRPSDQICRLSDEIGADLVVMSTSGCNGLKRLFLGSNAERVVQQSSVPVIVVRSGKGQVIDQTRPLRIQTILVPTDFSPASVEGVNYAISFAGEFGARLVVFHAFSIQDFVTPNPYGLYNVRPTPEEAHSAAEVLMREFVKKFDFGGVEFETHITTSGAAEGICDYAEQIKADLIITSTHGRTGFMHVLMGSVAEDVVRFARSPVLVVPGSLNQK